MLSQENTLSDVKGTTLNPVQGPQLVAGGPLLRYVYAYNSPWPRPAVRSFYRVAVARRDAAQPRSTNRLNVSRLPG